MKMLIMSLGGQDNFAYGPRVLSAYLKANHIETDLLLIPFVDPDRKKFFSPHWKFYDEPLIEKIIHPLPEFLKDKNYDLIGISLTSNFFDHARLITKLIKKNFTVPIVWGGVHPTVRPDECMQYADLVIRGEGENALLALVQAIEHGGGFEAVSSLTYKVNGEIRHNPIGPLVQDLDALPFQDYDFSTHYIAYHYRILPMNEDLIYKIMPCGFGDGSYGYSTMATRGCPYGCTYCINSSLRDIYKGKGKILRKRSYENVVDELADAKRRMPKLTYMLFSDETFLRGKGLDWIKNFCALYKAKVGLPFYCCFSPEDVSEEALAMLADAGLFNVQMGIQSGSKRTLIDVYDRKDNTENLVKAAHILNKFSDRIMPLFDVILDNPYETDEDRKETIKFLLRLPRPYELQLFSLTWYPGATITEKAVADGYVKDVIKDVYRKHYQSYDRTNYYNLLISMVPFFDHQWIENLMEKNTTFRYLYIRAFLWLWNSTRYVSGTWPYQMLKNILVRYFNVKPPVYAKLPPSGQNSGITDL
ncbi:MAG: B12-binding domain-containing radical SAM protein [Candidatus Schekmanbacteria bacterium]|nr:B12-binding domain-containing radical SAM protein [Candidatus Schekmanbacteria bacterium]